MCGTQGGMKKQRISYKKNTYIDSGVKFKTLKQILSAPEGQDSSYIQLSSRVSIKPGRKLCDLSGLPTPYTCPNTKLFYYDASVYKRILELSNESVQKLLKLREFGRALIQFRK